MASINLGSFYDGFSGITYTCYLIHDAPTRSGDNITVTNIKARIVSQSSYGTEGRIGVSLSINGVSKVSNATVASSYSYPTDTTTTILSTLTISNSTTSFSYSISFSDTGYGTGWNSNYSKSFSGSISCPAKTAPTITQSQTINSATSITVSGTSNIDCSQWAYQLDNAGWVYWTGSARSASQTITVSADTHTIQIAGKNSSNDVWGYGTTATLDTTLPTVSFAVSEIETNGFKITATSNVNCNQWWYSLDGGSTWISYSTTNTTSTNITLSNLQVNTSYTVKVRAKKTANNLTNDSSAQTVKTQGGIVHVKISNTWKDAIAYVKVGNAWKQAIVYTKVGNSWRIGT